jgi:DNA (cytosine-5)-methyltransferase 1
MKILELFGGIGACTNALKRLGIDIEVADYVEIDKYAVASYNAINETNFEPQDICEWDKETKVDLIMHGSPCQDFSSAGKQEGGNEGSGTRSSLMYETIRIVEKLRPKYVVWENVKNLLSAKHRHNFDNYIERMQELGYISYYQLLNAKDYGIPQNRERVFTISIRQDIDVGFVFPQKQPLEIRLKDLLEDEVDEKYYIKKTWHFTKENEQKHDTNEIAQIDNIGYKATRSITDINKICRTIDTMGGGNREPKILTNQLVRKLTPKECWRLMGFSDEDFEKAAKVNSNSQLYKQAGNSIVVNVLMEIFRKILN